MRHARHPPRSCYALVTIGVGIKHPESESPCHLVTLSPCPRQAGRRLLAKKSRRMARWLGAAVITRPSTTITAPTGTSSASSAARASASASRMYSSCVINTSPSPANRVAQHRLGQLGRCPEVVLGLAHLVDVL